MRQTRKVIVMVWGWGRLPNIISLPSHPLALPPQVAGVFPSELPSVLWKRRLVVLEVLLELRLVPRVPAQLHRQPRWVTLPGLRFPPPAPR
jgi:hypothetical protein